MNTNHVTVDFSKKTCVMKPMHAVNNGPVYKFTLDQRITNIDAFREAKIPYARTHDAAFYANYGGEHTVDILAIFPNFDADVNDPASYDFTLTDEYLKVMTFAGVKPFYRLGSKIEHWPKKYGTLVPKDFQKWAEICEHIIAHYTEGWADGFEYDINYWEIWNEADMVPDDTPLVGKKTWAGTKAQFFDFFAVAAKHLKKRFPHRKIGGPAVCGPNKEWVDDFFEYIVKNDVPLDFFSWHCYTSNPEYVFELEEYSRKLLDKYGYTKTESILNEWNYVLDWNDEAWVKSLRAEKSLKGAAFTAAVVAGSQYRPIDMLMYYDARPCAMNGLFNTDLVCDKLKGYYPFHMFGVLCDSENAVEAKTDDPSHLFACASGDSEKAAVMLTHFDDDDSAEKRDVKLSLQNIGIQAPVRVSFYLLDEEHDEELVREEILSGTDAAVYLTLPNFTTYLVKIEKA